MAVDVLNCERLEVGEHGVMRCDNRVTAPTFKEGLRSIRALGIVELRAGAHVEATSGREHYHGARCFLQRPLHDARERTGRGNRHHGAFEGAEFARD